VNPVPECITASSCHWGDINTETWSSMLRAGRKDDDFADKKNILLRKPVDLIHEGVNKSDRMI
jgi:hypothetical protein